MVPPDAALGSGGCPIPENTQDQFRQDSEPNVVEDVPAHGRDVGLDDL